MTLILVRHGQTDANAAGLLQGHADLPLNERGRSQAAACSTALRATVDAGATVVSSPLVRARQTATMIAGHESGVIVDEAWIELDYGSLDRLPTAEVPAATWAQWRADLSFVPGGGESIASLGVRVRAACDRLAEAAGSGDVIVVSHVSPIKAAVAWAIGVGDETSWRMQLDQASISRIGCATRGTSLRSFNETSHLGVRTGPSG